MRMPLLFVLPSPFVRSPPRWSRHPGSILAVCASSPFVRPPPRWRRCSRRGIGAHWLDSRCPCFNAPTRRGTNKGLELALRGLAASKPVSLLLPRGSVEGRTPSPSVRMTSCVSHGEGATIPAYTAIPAAFSCIILRLAVAGWSSQAARRAHNPKVTGSNPVPATSLVLRWPREGLFCAW